MINDVEQLSFSSATSLDGKLVLSSGVLSEKRQLRSFRNPRYEPNRGHLYSNSALFPVKSALSERSFGIFTAESGVGFRLRSGVLYAFRRTTVGGITTDIEDIISIPDNINLDKGNVFDIQFQWRGVGSYFFYINLQLVHTMDLLGTLDELSIFNPATPCAFECINLGEASELIVGCVDVTSEGGINNGKTYGSVTIENEIGQIEVKGSNTPVIAIRSKDTVGGLINTRDTLSLLATASTNEHAFFRIWATRDDAALILGTQVYKDFGDGHLEYVVNDETAGSITLDTTKAAIIFGARVAKDTSYGSSAIFEGRTEIYQTPGDIFIFTMHKEDPNKAVKVGITYEFAEAI